MEGFALNTDLLHIVFGFLTRRDSIRARRTCQLFRQACDSLPAGSCRPRLFLACSRQAKVLDIDPLAASCMVSREGHWIQRKGLFKKGTAAEPCWVTGICVNPVDGDVYALQYRISGVLRFSGNSMRYKNIAVKHPSLEVRKLAIPSNRPRPVQPEHSTNFSHDQHPEGIAFAFNSMYVQTNCKCTAVLKS